MKALPVLYCGVVATMAVLAAQTPSPTERRTTSAARPISPANRKAVTVIGCVMPDSAGAPSTASPNFVLSHIDPAEGAGVSGYKLSPASSAVSLKDHLSHKVELTGTVDGKAASRSASATTMPSLRVTSVKMVSTSCP